MKKAAASTQKPTTAAGLGTKRACPKCATKFYDFNKEAPVCPKCSTEIDVNAVTTPMKPEPPKRSKSAQKENAEESVLATDESADQNDFESVDELEDDDDDVVEDIEVEEENEF